MSQKRKCPVCLSYTSAIEQAWELADPCPYCGADLAPVEVHAAVTALIEFLLARITEDEAPALALYGASGAWKLEGARAAMGAEMLRTEHEHISIWNPTRVLTECEAKRRVLGMGWATEDLAELAAVLALPYADHPDYREGWKPTVSTPDSE